MITTALDGTLNSFVRFKSLSLVDLSMKVKVYLLLGTSSELVSGTYYDIGVLLVFRSSLHFDVLVRF